MADNRPSDSMEEQKRRQQELIELKRQKEAFMNNPDEFEFSGQIEEKFVQTRRSKLENFWYYSKFTIGFILIVAIILTIGITQCARREKYDLTVVLYFKNYVDGAMTENLATVFEKYCEDYNKDGKVNVQVIDCSLPQSEKLTNEKAHLLQAQLMDSKALIYVVDKEAYDELFNRWGFDFVSTENGLPHLQGTALQLNGTAFDMAFNKVNPNYINKTDYYLIRRHAGSASFSSDKEIKNNERRTDKTIRAILKDPQLKGENASNELNSKQQVTSK